MSQKGGGKATLVPVELPMKRKRGRPRKGEGSPSAQVEKPQPHPPQPPSSAQANQQKNTQEVEEKPPSPGPIGGNNKITNGDNSDSMVGQVVHGVIDADFGDGYLFSAIVGGISMRGVALKAGRVAPVTAANDVAPYAKMLRRQEIPFPNIGPQTQVESAAPASIVPSNAAGQKVTETGGETQPVNEEDPALVQKPDEDMKEAAEDSKSGPASGSPSDLAPGHEVQAADSELKSSGPEPVHAEPTEQDVELEQAPDLRSSSPKSPIPETTVEAIQEVAMDSKSKPNAVAIDEMKADLIEPDRVPLSAEPKKASSPQKQADTLAGPEPDSFAEMTLTLGLNQSFSSSEVESKSAGPKPKKSEPIPDVGFNLNIGMGQTPPTTPTDPEPLMILVPGLELAGSSVDGSATPPLKDNAMNAPSRDNRLGVEVGPADADAGDAKVAEGSIAS
ncbi:uncharacterized protein LOC116202681 [Punica granatum]|uniref:Uncharacterized protein n=2 Tax=Punica granatum TaxID=22663 RepID=A0A218XFE0_PUNGR|nr:uncharacterized protein LOC116202681 [Punica granatum]OWM83460.1 hypothetical protein CDL15_Pgr012941 [Punica granatum]PKI72306.1 hypothetical protein CRG98_007286 [Punica granatum]